MKNLNFKKGVLLYLFVLGIGYVNAQSVQIKTNYTRGYQVAKVTPTCNFNQLTLLSNSANWDTKTYNGELSGTPKEVITHENKSTQHGDNFDWFTLTYTAPEYSKITYTLSYELQTKIGTNNCNSKVRAAYFDYGTEYSKWFAHRQDPKGYTTFVTAENSSAAQKATGEHSCVLNTGSNTEANSNQTITVVVDNSDSNSPYVTSRYGGMSSSKAISATSFDHLTQLSMSYVASATYYKHITFNANGGEGDMPVQKVEGTASLSQNTFTHTGFVFAGWTTNADGTGTHYQDGSEITATADDKGPVTLYAQWTIEPVQVMIDYTYRTGIDGAGKTIYASLDDSDAAFTNKVRAIFRDINGNVLKSAVLTAPSAKAPDQTVDDLVATHKTATINLTLTKEGDEVLSGSECKVSLGENYAKYGSVDFEMLTNGSTSTSATNADHWALDKENDTNFLFKYEGYNDSGEKMFNLKWTVRLTGLTMYPTAIFVKPMREAIHDSGESRQQIPAMDGLKGEVCQLAGYITKESALVPKAEYDAKSAEEQKGFEYVGTYYEGNYNVLTKCQHNSDYTYYIGLTGFTLDGNDYHLGENVGDIPEDMISEEVNNDQKIDYTRTHNEIRVLILSPNGTNASVDGHLVYELYVDNKSTHKVNLSDFKTARSGYDFDCWKDLHSDAIYKANDVYNFSNGTTTLLAQWKRNTAPNVEPESLEEDGDNFIYKVKVTDDFHDAVSVKYIYTDDEDEPAADANWSEMSKSLEDDDTYTHTILLLNDNQGKHLWVKGANSGKNSIVYLGEVRSIYNVQANPNPDSHQAEEYDIYDWVQDGESMVFRPTGEKTTTNYYDYYSTFYYGDRTFMSYNAMAYTATIDDDKLQLVKIEPAQEGDPVVIPQGTAVILRKVQDTEGKIELEECAATSWSADSNKLAGLDSDAGQDNSYKYYMLSYGQYGLGFYLMDSSKQLGAHKAFVKVENSDSGQSPVRAFTLNFDGDDKPIVTAIRDIETAGTAGNTGAIFDLSGRKVSEKNIHTGIYVKGGNKVLK